MNNRKGILGAGNWIDDYVKVIDAWQSGHLSEYPFGLSRDRWLTV
jgi:hypothetical protein